MSNYYAAQPSYGGGPAQPAPGGPSSAANLQFYPSSYDSRGGVSGAQTPQQASYYGVAAHHQQHHQSGYGASPAQGFGAPPGGFSGGVSGRMGEQGGLRTGWLAAFSTEGYDGEPPLMEELGVNFGHIQSKVAPLHIFKTSRHTANAT